MVRPQERYMNYSEAFDFFTNLIQSDKPFAFSRYCDGEAALLMGEEIGTNTQAWKTDRWSAPEGSSPFTEELMKGLQHDEDNFYYGFATMGDDVDRKGTEFVYDNSCTENISFASVFTNANYQKWLEFLPTIKKRVVVITNKQADFPFPYITHAFMDDCVNAYNNNPTIFDQYIELARKSGQTFFISAGPAANILIDKMYKLNPDNQYVDVGSSLDEFVHGRKTRPFMNPQSKYATQVSKRSHTTAILNGFRRPENLSLQLEALHNQTLPPDEILVWYNNPGEDYALNREVLETQKTTYSSKNFGVWSRFFHALNARNTYVCVFDDDTIPGSKWIENCLDTMKKREGLLGTNGMRWNFDTYQGSCTRFGWINPKPEIVEVDIVGHSWFFKREWLSYFTRELHSPAKHQLHGEDMHFSYMLQKYANIPTLVPPHPEDDKSMWGSIKAEELGENDEAISWNPNNYKKFCQFYRKQKLAGWKLVMEQ